MKELRFAMFGAGFWAPYQLAAWQEITGAKCVAICDCDLSKAQKLATDFGIEKVYEKAAELLACEQLDFIDIVTSAETHAELALLGAEHGLAVICQKPMAASLDEASQMVAAAQQAGTLLLVHENWRWQAPLRKLKSILDSGRLGKLVRARIDYANTLPVFDSQPFLKQLEKFILADMGTHLLDVSRFLFGEAEELYCQTRQMHTDIAGEDVATVMMRVREGLTVTCNISYASRWEFDHFPDTFVFVEGTRGGVTVGANCEVKFIGESETLIERVKPQAYNWANPAYGPIHPSIVDCHRNLLGALRGETQAETTGEDNLKTLELVHIAYESAERDEVIMLTQWKTDRDQVKVNGGTT